MIDINLSSHWVQTKRKREKIHCSTVWKYYLWGKNPECIVSIFVFIIVLSRSIAQLYVKWFLDNIFTEFKNTSIRKQSAWQNNCSKFNYAKILIGASFLPKIMSIFASSMFPPLLYLRSVMSKYSHMYIKCVTNIFLIWYQNKMNTLRGEKEKLDWRSYQ